MSDNNENSEVNSEVNSEGDDVFSDAVSIVSKKSRISRKQQKQELLIKLRALEEKGVNLSRKFRMSDRLSDIQFEYDKQKKQAETEAGVKFMRRMLMASVTGIEFLNKKFDPIDAKLDGWSESIMENINDYDNGFEKLHAKYSEKVEVAPEVELLMTLAGSAFMFHLTNTLFKSALPGLGDVIKGNPNLMQNIAQAMGTAMNQAGDPNLDPRPCSRTFSYV